MLFYLKSKNNLFLPHSNLILSDFVPLLSWTWKICISSDLFVLKFFLQYLHLGIFFPRKSSICFFFFSLLLFISSIHIFLFFIFIFICIFTHFFLPQTTNIENKLFFRSSLWFMYLMLMNMTKINIPLNHIISFFRNLLFYYISYFKPTIS